MVVNPLLIILDPPVFLMLFWDYFRKKWRMQDLKVVNSLGTALFCCTFNLVDTDQFSCEYLVWVLCYCSQTDVLFPHWVGALAHTRDAENAPPIAGVKPEMCCDLDIFRWIWCFGLAADWPKHIAVAMVSAKCCFSYGECAKVCFRGVLKPQNVKDFPAAILFS